MRRLGFIILSSVVFLSLLICLRGAGTFSKVSADVNCLLPEFSKYIPADSSENFVSRLREYDDVMNIVGYLNDDGTKSLFVYDDDIKFRDSDGFIREKDTRIVPCSDVTGYSYSQEANDFQTFFSGEGEYLCYKISYDLYDITIIPDTEEPVSELFVYNYENEKASECGNENFIEFSNAFYDGSLVRYTTGLSGLKEEIILDSYPEVKSFGFQINCGSLTAQLSDGCVLFSDSDGNKQFVFPRVILYDSCEDGRHYSFDSTVFLEEKSPGEYIYTIVPDDDFLKSKDTIYPVFIDPTITCANSLDAVVYSKSNKANTNFGYDSINMIGYSSANGKGYFYSKPNLSSLGSINYENVISVSYHIREISGNSSGGLVEAYMVSESWSEGTITWNNKPSHLEQKLTGLYMKYDPDNSENNWYSFYVTQACRGWLQGISKNGIVLIPHDDSVYKAVGSREYTSSYAPYWKIVYLDEEGDGSGLGMAQNRFYIKNKQTKKYLTESNNYTYTSDFTGNSNQQWTLVPVNSGYWKICPYTYTYLCLGLTNGSDTSGTGLSVLLADTSDPTKIWKFTRNWNGTYKIQAKSSINLSNSFSITENNSQVFIYPHILDYDFSQDWTLEPVNLGVAEFYAQLNYVPYAISYAENAGFTAFSYRIDEDGYDAGTIFDSMPSDMLVYTGSIGLANGIRIGEVGYTYSYLCGVKPAVPASATWYISDYDSNELKNVFCLMYESSNSGSTAFNIPSNIVGMSSKRGAHFVISWTTVINGMDFRDRFMQAISEGNTIYNALEAALENRSPEYGMNSYHYLGDTDIIFCHQTDE